MFSNNFVLAKNNESKYETAQLQTTKSKGFIETHDISELSKVKYDETYSYKDVLLDKYMLGLISESEYNHKINNLNNTYNMAASRSYVRYMKFTMDSYSFRATSDFSTNTYVLTPIFYVGLDYGNDSSMTGQPDSIVALESPHIYTGDGANCVFGGKIFYRLQSGRSFYYGVYGDVYKTANVSISGGIKIGIGDSATASFNISSSSNFLKNVDFDGNYYSAALNP